MDVFTDYNAHYLLGYSNVTNKGVKLLQGQYQEAVILEFSSLSVQVQRKGIYSRYRKL